MENKRFLTAQDVMEMLDVSLSYAYKLIRRLNAELESEGFVTIKVTNPSDSSSAFSRRISLYA